MTSPLKVYVSISDFGSDEAKRALVDYVVNETVWHAFLNDDGVIVLELKVTEMGWFASSVAADPKLNWIEYTLQFEH
jgi:hypothetical protein